MRGVYRGLVSSVRAWLLVGCALASGCDGDDGGVLVQVRTDMIAPTEFDGIRVELESEDGRLLDTEDYRLAATDDPFAGVRVAEMTGLASGLYYIRATLMQGGGAVVSRRIVTAVEGGLQLITVPITRDCVGVMCPDGQQCLDGLCVEEACGPEQPDACTPTCDGDAACQVAGAACIVGRCVEGFCFDVPDDTRCEGAAMCAPDDVCVGGEVDAGPPDAGPPDAGPPPMPLAGVQTMALGEAHSCATTGDGRYCWGDNRFGQFGSGDTTSATEPRWTMAGSAAPTSGANHVCIHGPRCWGDNQAGQLGVMTPMRAQPTPIPITLPNADGNHLALGSRHTCSDVSDLCVGPGGCTYDFYCWGDNSSGQLGDGTRRSRGEPMGMGVAWAVRGATAGDAHTCVLQSPFGPSELYCWGENEDGQLGNGTQSDRLTPTRIAEMDDADVVRAGRAHTCARRDGELFCWGDNRDGQLGLGGETLRATSPTAVPGLPTTVSSFCAGSSHTCAVLGGEVRCWGSDEQGQLGDGPAAGVGIVQALAPGSASAVFCGSRHTCAVMTDNKVRCWGLNDAGQLGDGTTETRHSPVIVLAGTGAGS